MAASLENLLVHLMALPKVFLKECPSAMLMAGLLGSSKAIALVSGWVQALENPLDVSLGGTVGPLMALPKVFQKEVPLALLTAEWLGSS